GNIVERLRPHDFGSNIKWIADGHRSVGGRRFRKVGDMTKAYAVPAPSDSVLAPLYVGADLLDAFAIRLPAGASNDLEVLTRIALERQAGWIRALTSVRDTMMAIVGVKSSRAI